VTRKKVILITGPTASGKTAMAISVAQRFNTAIISADSRQCYREMNIGVARPSPEELAQVPHHFIGSHSIHDTVNAATFEQYALAAADKIFQQRDVVVMAGGTGLYIKAFCEGLDDMPAVDPEIRKSVVTSYEMYGMEWLKNEVATQDPLYYSGGEILNPRRLMRALEVKLSTGTSIKNLQKKTTKPRDFHVIKYGLDIARPQLHANINHRVDRMLREGLAAEVESLLPWRHLNALQTVGYTELFDYFDNKISLADAAERIRLHTRHYAKRQMTWFRKDPAITWIKEEKDIRI
jgi:tRNA dimethylallyltransferase